MITTSLPSDAMNPTSTKRVAYLLGAGATQGCISYAGSTTDLLMSGLLPQLSDRWHDLIYTTFPDEPSVKRLLNDVVNEDTDFEHLLTFLDDAPSEVHQRLARELMELFSTVLRAELDKVTEIVGDDRSLLYAALVDMHSVLGNEETLGGILTLNYDVFLEHAIEHHLERPVDFGIRLGPWVGADPDAIRVLKLHGSFGWRHVWPIEDNASNRMGLWIPPGIRKEKAQYPFNIIWGLARELLDCDILRIIGCNLGSNDWDLVSLLFTTLHTRSNSATYDVEVISPPETADRIARDFPYLNITSLLELPDVGPSMVAELLPGAPQAFETLDAHQRSRVSAEAQRSVGNSFERWLRLKGENLFENLGALETGSGIFREFVDRGV